MAGPGALSAMSAGAIEKLHVIIAPQHWSGATGISLSVALYLLLVCHFLFNRYHKGLEKVPGPFLNSISTIPRIWSVYRASSHVDDMRLHQKYGHIVRVAPRIISVSDTASVEHLYGITTKFVKSEFFKLGAFTDDKGEYIPDPFSTQDRHIHSRLKRGAANAYSLASLVKMEPLISPVTNRLLKLLDRHADSGTICDFGDVLKNYAMDAIFCISFGQDMNYLEKGDHIRLYHVLDIFASYMAIQFGQIPWCHKFLLKNPRLAEWIAGNDTSQLQMMDLAIRETEASFSKPPSDGPETFVQLLVNNQRKSPTSITIDEIHGNALGNISAGSDTTATALRAVIYLLLKNPTAYQRLCDEVRSNLELPVKFKEASKLTYLNACIKEALRMHPPVGMLLGRQAPQGGEVVNGFHIAEGIEIGINPMILHHDTQVFPDPYEYNPGRWLKTEQNEEHLKLMNRCLIAFGHGRHICSGQHISMVEMTNLIPTLLIRYDLKLANNGRNYKFKNWWFTTQTGLEVLFSRR
ncbi:unnamed protein product [Clonostachys rosea]|uniref:Cytochrome P450 n=1 Tax=Bionectria ochroleuca TaxID=29856 RepID=A0ABY6TXF3_BIOOC|nr:unnamed protein product [Clonostachys rosea]